MGYVEQFCGGITERSEADSYEQAIKEWVYEGEHNMSPIVDHCLCGHPIKEVFLVTNANTHQTVRVGNCCIKKFGIRREHWNRSRLNYLQHALGKAELENQAFVNQLIEKTKKYPTTRMTGEQRRWLERLTGHPWRWKIW